jgi:hypothetical protein
MEQVLKTIEIIRNYDLSTENRVNIRTALVVNLFKSFIKYHKIENEGAVFALASMFGDELFKILSNTQVHNVNKNGLIYTKKNNDDKLVIAPSQDGYSIVITNNFPYNLTTSIGVTDLGNNKCCINIEGVIPSLSGEGEFLQNHRISIIIAENGLVEGYRCVTDGKHLTLPNGKQYIADRVVNRSEDRKGFSVDNLKCFKNKNGKWEYKDDYWRIYIDEDFAYDSAIAPIEDILRYTNRENFGFKRGISKYLTENVDTWFPKLSESLKTLNEEQDMGSR